MKRECLAMIGVILVATLAVAAFSQAAPAPKAGYPAPGRVITVIVPLAAGGSVYVGARLIATALEKDLKVSIQVVAKPGAGTQVGMTELALAKPDGYTLGYAPMPSINTAYLDPERKATYDRKSFVPIGRATMDPNVIAVRSNSPFTDMKSLIEAAKTKPGQIKLAASGILSGLHLTALQVEKQAGVKFANVHFDGGAPGRTALMGGHVDASVNALSEVVPQHKSGELRVVGVALREDTSFLPGAKTMESQGYKVYMVSSHTLLAPAGTPREVVDTLSQALEKALNVDEVKSRLQALSIGTGYLDSAQLATFWEQSDAEIKELMAAVQTK
jgi:tripartite-type tricarboxylate transporter receptor subunit TctC